MDIGTFHVQRAIIHQIPEARLDQKPEIVPILAETDSELDTRRKTYFQRRIRRSLQNGFAVERDPGELSPVPSLIVDFFNSEGSNFVEISQKIALHLHASQTGTSPSGLVAVIEGVITSGTTTGKCFVVLKLEMEEGVHFELVEVDGKKTFTMSVEDVTLTESTRVFKAGLFPRSATIGALTGVASDSQLDSATVGREIAEYFLRRFLGCRVEETARIATKRYLEAAMQFVNELPRDEKKLRYETAVLADLNSQVPTINPEAFARQHLDEEDRDTFVAMFKEGDGRVREIRKDVELIQSQVRRSWVEMDDGVRVSGPPEAVERAVRAIQEAVDQDGEPIVTAGIKRVR